MRTVFLILIGLSSVINAADENNFTRVNGVISDSITNLEWQDDYTNNGESTTL